MNNQILSPKKMLLVAFNAKFSHTSLALRYLRQACINNNLSEPELLELTINNHIPDILGEIYEYKPAVLGIACYIWNIRLVQELLPLLRQVLPQTIIICGGPEVSYDTKNFLAQNSVVDFVIRGEGEKPLVNLLTQLAATDNQLESCKKKLVAGDFSGIAFCYEEQYQEGSNYCIPDMAEVPFAYQAEEMPNIKEKILYYETSRGCPFSCSYCLSCATAGVRYRSLELVLAELAFFVEADVRQVKFVDRTFNAKKSHFMPILHFIKELPNSCRTNFHFEMAIDYLDQETIQVLQSLPRQRVQLEIGIQTTNPEVLARVQRVNHWEKIVDNIQEVQKNHNIHVHTDLIIGLPGEDMASFAKSFNDVYALDTNMLQLGFLKFLKGATMMNLVEEFDYQYMNIGPYEVLSNNLLSYGDIHWLHCFEAVFELYHNGGRCRKTSNYFIMNQENNNAFAFYQKLTDYWIAKGYQHQAHSPMGLYEKFQNFLSETYGSSGIATDLIDNLLRFDALLADKGKFRPENLQWNRELYQPVTAEFWREKSAVNAGNVLENYHFTTWRDLRRNYQLEMFSYQVQNSQEVLVPQTQWILFDFTQGETVYRPLAGFGE